MICRDADTALRKIKGAAEGDQEKCVAVARTNVTLTNVTLLLRATYATMTKARGAPRNKATATRLLHAPENQAADLTSIFLACAGAGFGTVTLSTPLAMLALMASASTPSGSSSVRSNEP